MVHQIIKMLNKTVIIYVKMDNMGRHYQYNPIDKLFAGYFNFKGHKYLDKTPLHYGVSFNRPEWINHNNHVYEIYNFTLVEV